MLTKHWDEAVAKVESRAIKGWLDWGFIEREYIRPAVSGDSDVYYLGHFFATHLPHRPVAHALSLGCGGGNLERGLIGLNAATTIDAYDVSAESIRLAKELAEEAGMASRIHYDVRDINQIALPHGQYDFVIAKMSLHHFERLEHVFEQIRLSLKPDGVFVFNDFIGPSRYQWTDVQLDLMNAILETLPDRNRHSTVNNDILRRIDRPSVHCMIQMDPSEAVRSEEILPTLRKVFEVIEYKPYGGTLLHILLTHLMPSFDLENEDQRSLLKMLFLMEKTLIRQGVLQSDFAYAVAKPLVGPPKALPVAAQLPLASAPNGRNELHRVAGLALRSVNRAARKCLRPVKRLTVNCLELFTSAKSGGKRQRCGKRQQLKQQ
jgi:2-polyprenyl-3-methyl-5-hydroxy-6-metoxy-1,4-benzoquinol methylase